MLTTIVSLIVTLSVLILIHEFGHFFAAKAVGIYAPRFSLGLGPRVAGFRVGETEFVLSAIPLGGYVKMAGMEADEAGEALEGGPDGGEAPVDPSRTFDAKPLWARTLVISAGVIMNLLFAFVVFTGLSMWYGQPVDPSTRLVPPSAAGPAAPLAAVPYGARVVAVGDRAVHSSTDAYEGLHEAPAGPVQVRFADAPPVMLQLPAGEAARLELVRQVRFAHDAIVGTVVQGRPAARAGIRSGDRIAAVGGRTLRSWEDAVAAIEGSPGRPVALQVVRGGRTLSISVTPSAETGRDASGRTVAVGKIGISPDIPDAHRPVSVGRAIGDGFFATRATASSLFDILHKLVSGQESARNMGGLLTIADASGESARMGMEYFLTFMALFSVNLAVLNILPIPILDGGHLLFLAIEAVRGRPLSVEARIRFSHVGLLIVVALMVWANANDILRKLGI
ncbi:MAG: Zinc metalloprotease [Gemmatimonadetes bacterium]|nr:Zinc metalloprotease [Gemmatimonadota bacterium]